MFSLDVGENEALALMEQISDAMFLTDDAAARIVAKQLGYNVHGTIGILVRAIRRSQMSPKEVLDILTDIPLKSSLYIRLSLLEDIQKKIKSNFNI
jgi:predicted nucleic acid-binding protein